MKVLVSWAQRDPGDWLEVDARQFRTLPNQGVPELGARGNADNAPGYLSNLMVQGVMFNGLDHVAVAPYLDTGEDGVRVWAWNDDPDDYPVGQRVARVHTFLPLAPDPTFGSGNRERLLDSIRNEPGITEARRAEVLAWHNDPAHFPMNTRQAQVVYAEGDRYDRLLQGLPQYTTLRRWDEFEALVKPTIDPAITRHGIWVPDEHWERQVEARTPTGWMHWNEHLPESECDWERDEIRHNRRMRELRVPRRVLKEQRAQGRYSLAPHTITYYERDSAQAVGYIAANTAENLLSTTTATAGTQAATTTTNSSDRLEWVFSTDVNQPNSSDWPNGTFNIQDNCTAISAGVVGDSNGLSTVRRISSDLATSLATTNLAVGFTTTGTKLRSVVWDSAAGAAADRFAVHFFARGDSHGDSITLQFNTTDSYADGPWTSGTAIDGAVAGEGTLAATLVPNIPITAALQRYNYTWA